MHAIVTSLMGDERVRILFDQFVPPGKVHFDSVSSQEKEFLVIDMRTGQVRGSLTRIGRIESRIISPIRIVDTDVLVKELLYFSRIFNGGIIAV